MWRSVCETALMHLLDEYADKRAIMGNANAAKIAFECATISEMRNVGEAKEILMSTKERQKDQKETNRNIGKSKK